MANLSPAVLILILVAAVIVALLIGYFLGTRFGGKKSVAMKQTTEKHEQYKSDVREHFEQTSAIMSRMVEDYRDMYEHLSTGAQQLADIHPEKRVTPPPAPEAITDEQGAKQEPASDADQSENAARERSGSASHSDHNSTHTQNAKAASAKAGDDSDGENAAAAETNSGEKTKTGEKSGQANNQAAAKGDSTQSEDSAQTEQPAKSKKEGKRYGLE